MQASAGYSVIYSCTADSARAAWADAGEWAQQPWPRAAGSYAWARTVPTRMAAWHLENVRPPPGAPLLMSGGADKRRRCSQGPTAGSTMVKACSAEIETTGR